MLGLGDIGPEAAMPVMEGKCMLFKEFAGVDAFPICLDTKDPDEIVQAVELIAPTFGGINLEDISAPRCFEIEDRLKESLDIPVFHDDQHGTAVVTMAALFNALKIVGKPIEDMRVLMVGLGAAGVAVTKMMLASGVTDIIGCDRQGALSTERADYQSGEMNAIKRWYAEISNPNRIQGQPADVIEGMRPLHRPLRPGDDRGQATWRKMNDDAIVFAMANPTPEVMPEDAAPYVRIMATGRSDYPNQINNVLCFPGIFRGALDAGAPQITEEMKLAAAQGIADVVTDDDLAEDYIIPCVFNRDVAPTVADAVVEEAKRAGSPALNEETGTFARWRRLTARRLVTMKVLVTGASGLIGSALCDSLLARGDQVVGLSRDPERRARASPAIDWHPWEPTLERPPAEAFDGVDGVVHLLGEPIAQRWSAEAQAADHGDPPHRHPQPGGGDRRARASGRRCWSASRRSAIYGDRGDAVLDEYDEPGGESFDSEVVRRLGAGGARGRGDRRAAGDRPQRPGARPPAAACSASC